MTPLRVLHAVGKLDRGGIETWLMHLLRRLDRQQVAFDFLVETAQPGDYDEEARSLGARVIHCERNRDLPGYFQRLSARLRQFGPFDVVHGHAHFFNGLILLAAARVGVPGRVAHSHTDLRAAGERRSLLKRSYYFALKQALRQSMTKGLAVSDEAARELFGDSYSSDRRIGVMHCGVDYAELSRGADTAVVRRELGIAAAARVVGHVGRFHTSKNHQFLIEAFAAAARRDPALHLLLVGGGELQKSEMARVQRLGLSDRVTFAGVRGDVPRMLSAMDAFALPSRYEGLAVVLVEAQAAALPIVVSDRVPNAALISGHWIARRSLDDQTGWVDAILDAVAVPQAIRRPSRSPRFDINENLRELMTVYREGFARTSRDGPLLVNAEQDVLIGHVANAKQRRHAHPNGEKSEQH